MKLSVSAVVSIFVILTAPSAIAQAQKIDGIAAIVDKEIILYSEVVGLAEQEAVMLNINKATEPEKYIVLIEKWFGILLDEKIQVILAEADSLVEVRDEDVEAQADQQIQSYVQSLGSEEAVENQFRMTVTKLKEALVTRLQKEALIQRLKFVVTGDVIATRSEIISFYETYKDSIPPIPKTFNLSHILKVPTNLQEALDAKRGFLDSLRHLIVNEGYDFAELAVKHSDDPGSARSGGDLGWQSPGSFFPEFDAAVAELDSGEVSGIIKTPVGFHIIQLLGREGVKFHSRHILAFLNVTEDDAVRTVAELNEYRVRALAGEDFSELALRVSDDPDVQERKGYLEDWNLERLQQRLPEFRQPVENMKAGEISEPFRTQFGYHIVKVNKISLERVRDLDTDYEYIRDLTIAKKQGEYYLKWFQEQKEAMYIDVKIESLVKSTAESDTTGAIKKK